MTGGQVGKGEMPQGDKVIGTAVLVSTEAHEWLFYLAVGKNYPANGSWNDLPMLEATAQKPAAVLPDHFPENKPWRYQDLGGTLDVQPSIKIGNDFWHNEGRWQVRFVRFPEKLLESEIDSSGERRLDVLRALAAANPGPDGDRVRAFLNKTGEFAE